VTGLRPELGKSLATVQRFDAPLPQVTASSLQALQAFANGERVYRQSGAAAAFAYQRRAVELDPNVALANATICNNFATNLQEPRLAAEYICKAYELRGCVTEGYRQSRSWTRLGQPRMNCRGW